MKQFFPMLNDDGTGLDDGSFVSACSFCAKAIKSRKECIRHYSALASKPAGYYQCPFGFTTRTFAYGGFLHAITGVIAYPRFDTPNEREMSKRHPSTKVTRAQIESILQFYAEIERMRADATEEAAQILPQALHELRKLAGAVLQHAEREIEEIGESPGLLSVRSAAELMRNNFDILEALSNIDSMRALPIDATVNLFDLAYKMKRVLKERADARKMGIAVNGVRAIIRGSQKSFPIVPHVLVENAIKYGRPDSVIRVDVTATNRDAFMTVENESDYQIDTVRCFDRGSRFARDKAEGGGYGLYLAREIVNAHHGVIRCDRDGSSIKMVVTIPLVNVIPQRP